jgi:hypothetical protein
VRGPSRAPVYHSPTARDLRPPVAGEEEEEDRFIGRACYVFNRSLRGGLDDTRCSHCIHYLTSRCPYIDEFLDDVEDLSPE